MINRDSRGRQYSAVRGETLRSPNVCIAAWYNVHHDFQAERVT